MKKIRTLILVVLVLVVVLVLAKNMIIKTALSAGIKALTGLELQIESINLGIVKTLIDIKGLKILNPKEFPDKMMVDVPRILVDYDLGAFLKKKVHFEELELNLKELIVVKNENGQLNLNSLKVVKATKEEKPPEPSKQEPGERQEKGEMPQIQIDLLKLKIGRVVYKDYSRGTSPQVTEFKVNIDKSYENITDPQALVSLIMVNALTRTTISNLANFDLGPLKGEVSDLLGKKGIKRLSDDAMEKVTSGIKKLFPFGKGE